MTPWSRTIINIRIDKKEKKNKKNNNEKNRTKEERRLLHSMDSRPSCGHDDACIGKAMKKNS